MEARIFFKTGRMGRFLRFIRHNGLLYIFMIAMVLFTALPLIYVVSTAFKPLEEQFLFPPRFFVQRPVLTNFEDLFYSLDNSTIPFGRYFFNSLLTSGVTVFLTVMVSTTGAFALVKYKLPGVGFVFNLVVAALTFSPHVTTIPSYMLVNAMGMVNTYWALIVPKIAVAYNFFLCKQFVEQLPDEVLESARMDGASEWSLFWRIVMPMLKPAWSTLIVMSFVSLWNDSVSPVIYITQESMRTLPVAIGTIAGGVGNVARAGAVSAAVLITITPTILIYVIMQRRVMETMAHSGIKA